MVIWVHLRTNSFNYFNLVYEKSGFSYLFWLGRWLWILQYPWTLAQKGCEWGIKFETVCRYQSATLYWKNSSKTDPIIKDWVFLAMMLLGSRDIFWCFLKSFGRGESCIDASSKSAPAVSRVTLSAPTHFTTLSFPMMCFFRLKLWHNKISWLFSFG